jgi:two-component system cell cycle response regulator DivK
MSGETILIIEDNEKNLKLMRDILQFKGYHTLEAETAEEGIRIARESIPDLILLDIQLPGMNGIEALGVLRGDADTAGIPAIAVTASVMTHDRGKLIEVGFDDYQSKPIEIKEFLDRVEQMLEAGRS